MSSLLGLPDGEIAEDDKLSWDTNKIGGEPNWMYEGCDVVNCDVCGNQMKLVVQVYCPLVNSPYHRTLYISTCCNKHCWNKPHSWRVQRSQILDQSATSTQQCKNDDISDVWGVDEDDWGDATSSKTVTMDTKDWCDDADDWGDNNDAVSIATNTPSELSHSPSILDPQSIETLHLEKMNLVDGDCADTNSNHSNSSLQSSDIVQEEADDIVNQDSLKDVLKILASSNASSNSATIESMNYTLKIPSMPFDSYYLSVLNECEFKMENIEVGHLVKNYEKESGSDLKMLLKSKAASGREGGDREEYEKTNIKGDKFAYKFLKRIKLCPQQCIRYEWNGGPLFISQPTSDQSREITCSYCSGPCVFELQVMSPLVNLLKNKEGQTAEFGTVLVYSCKNSCWSPNQKILDETCFVQSDPDQHLFKV